MNFGSFELGIFSGNFVHFELTLWFFSHEREVLKHFVRATFVKPFYLGEVLWQKCTILSIQYMLLGLGSFQMYHEISEPWLYPMHNVHVRLWSWSYLPPDRCNHCTWKKLRGCKVWARSACTNVLGMNTLAKTMVMISSLSKANYPFSSTVP